jgi:hypothetical protein
MQPGQDQTQAMGVFGLDPRFGALNKEPFEAFVLEALDHTSESPFPAVGGLLVSKGSVSATHGHEGCR